MTNPNPDPSKHKEVPIWNQETWLYEDFVVGERARSITLFPYSCAFLED